MVENKYYFRSAKFLKSAFKLNQLPADEGGEILFLGRSNAGKSSLINKLCNQVGLCRVSKMPGRTQALNVFTLNNQNRIIDAPGYGYAKVSGELKKNWLEFVLSYCQQRVALKAVVVIMDVRHPLSADDLLWLDALESLDHPVVLIANKIDKISKQVLSKTIKHIRSYLQQYDKRDKFLYAVSAKNGLGVELLSEQLATFLI